MRPPLPAVLLAPPLLLALVLTLFAWPSARLGPRDLPVGIVGPPPSALPRGLDVREYADEGAARVGVRRREVYAAVAPGTLYTASAASPAVAQSLQQALGGRVVDLVPAPDDDPRGAAFAASTLPLIIAGLVAGAGVAAALRGGWARAGALAGIAALAGMAAGAIAQSWLGVLDGSWFANAAVLGLIVLAVGAVVAGASSLAGLRGVGTAAALMVLIGNPWAGVASAPELLPSLAGVTGQLLPPGAGGTLLRSVAFFDGHGGGGALLVLLSWALLGLLGIAVGSRRRAGTTETWIPSGSSPSSRS